MLPAIIPAVNCDIAFRRETLFFFVMVFSLIKRDMAQTHRHASANTVTLNS
jgi:hypothetical protein